MPGAPLNYFLHSAGPAAQPTMVLGWVFTAICVGVCIVVAALLSVALLRQRQLPEKDSLHAEEGGLRWIYIGTGISTFILFAMTTYALIILNDAANPPRSPALTITVTAYQWWWEAVYDAQDPHKKFATANEIHIPVGVPVLLELKTADVIHTFWVPKLAGKTQMIPGLINRQWLEADAPGIFRGQCAQYCGVQHAHMALEVVADDPDDFERWKNAQRSAAAPVSSPGQKIFAEDCGACHAARGTAAAGTHAPDLTHLQSRRLLAAGMIENTPGNLEKWLLHPQEIKPGVRMPDFSFSDADKQALLAYLATLK